MQISEKVSKTWHAPSVVNVHWDGKLQETLDCQNKAERLPVLVSGIGGIKLLEVPSVPQGSCGKTGHLIGKATVDLLEKWGCENHVAGMVFDTTSSDTGCRR